MFSFDDLTKPLTRQQVLESLYSVLGILGVDTTSWKPGAVLRTFFTGTAVVMAAFSRLIAYVARSGWVELAEGAWLTLAAWYIFRVQRQEATFATGQITLTNHGGGVFEIDPDELTFSSELTGKTYRNAEGFTLGPLETATIAIRATEAGASSSAPPGTITRMDTPLTGVECANERAVIGQDAETDPEVRRACYEKLGALSPNGPADAYSYVAKRATRADGTRIGVTRVRLVDDGAGGVEVICATATGQVDGDHIDPSTDLGAIQLALLQNAEPVPVATVATSAEPQLESVEYTIWVYDDVALSDAQLEQLIAARLTEYFGTLPIGGVFIYPGPGKVYRSALQAVIGSVRPAGAAENVQLVARVDIHEPSVEPEFGARKVPVLAGVTCRAVRRISREVL